MSSDARLVVFDLGRVLIRICDSWQHACEIAGLAVPPGEMSESAKAALDDAVVRSEVGLADIDAFCACVAPHLNLPVGHVRKLSDGYLRGPYPGAVDLINALSAAGVQTACLSNTNENHWRIMNDPAAMSFFPLDRLTHRFASQLVGLRKPDPQIYEHVERASGIEPRRIIFFDDVEENVAAARHRGWRAHQVSIDRDPIAQVREHLGAAGVLS